MELYLFNKNNPHKSLCIQQKSLSGLMTLWHHRNLFSINCGRKCGNSKLGKISKIFCDPTLTEIYLDGMFFQQNNATRHTSDEPINLLK